MSKTDNDNLYRLSMDGIIHLRKSLYPSLINKLLAKIKGQNFFEYNGSAYPCYIIKRIGDNSKFNVTHNNSVIVCQWTTFRVSRYASDNNVALCYVDNIKKLYSHKKYVLDIKKSVITDVKGNILANII